MIAMGMVQVAIDQIVRVVAVWNGFVSATWAVHVAGFMPRAMMAGRAAVGVGGRNLDRVLVDVIAVDVVQMAIVQIIDVAIVLHRGVAAGRAMLVRMVGVVWFITVGHLAAPSSCARNAGSNQGCLLC